MERNALRKELAELLEQADGKRRPALRRSLLRDWLYAADLAAACPGHAGEALAKELRAAGWETREDGDWTQMRKPVYRPPEGWYSGPFGPEAACCASLLERHPGGPEGEDPGIICRLIKAGEEGPEAVERVCAELHREWAARMRAGKPLPGISREYFARDAEGGKTL